MKSQGDSEDVNPLQIIRRFNEENVRYLLIGSMALSMHSAPFGSADWDFWADSYDRKKVYKILSTFHLSEDHLITENKPLVTFTDNDYFKLDVFFVKAFSNRKLDITLHFKDTYKRSIIKKDPKGDFFVRVPTIDDLLTMLRIIEQPRLQHIKHIEYLEALKKSGR